jgi:hypothetical protein
MDQHLPRPFDILLTHKERRFPSAPTAQPARAGTSSTPSPASGRRPLTWPARPAVAGAPTALDSYAKAEYKHGYPFGTWGAVLWQLMRAAKLWQA